MEYLDAHARPSLWKLEQLDASFTDHGAASFDRR